MLTCNLVEISTILIIAINYAARIIGEEFSQRVELASIIKHLAADTAIIILIVPNIEQHCNFLKIVTTNNYHPETNRDGRHY